MAIVKKVNKPEYSMEFTAEEAEILVSIFGKINGNAGVAYSAGVSTAGTVRSFTDKAYHDLVQLGFKPDFAAKWVKGSLVAQQ